MPDPNSCLTREEWAALDRGEPVRTGPEWVDCPNCHGGIVGRQLGPLGIVGKCLCCAAPGRVLKATEENSDG